MHDPERSRRLLFSIAYRMLGRVTEAEDMVQETFLRWHRPAPFPSGRAAGGAFCPHQRFPGRAGARRRWQAQRDDFRDREGQDEIDLRGAEPGQADEDSGVIRPNQVTHSDAGVRRMRSIALPFANSSISLSR